MTYIHLIFCQSKLFPSLAYVRQAEQGGKCADMDGLKREGSVQFVILVAESERVLAERTLITLQRFLSASVAWKQKQGELREL